MNSIKILQSDKRKLFHHLLKNQNQENIAVLFCGVCRVEKNLQMLVKEIWHIESDSLDVHSRFGLEFKDEMYRKILLHAEKHGYSIIIVHSHPFAEKAWFSLTDNNNDMRHAQFIKTQLPNVFYGNMVVAQKNWNARLFHKEKECFEEITKLESFGEFTASANGSNNDIPELDRNYRAFGREGQAIISSLKIALVGCGGLGWIIAPQLAGVGVRKILLIDHDTLEITNLNRMPAAPYSAIGQPKAKVLSGILQSMNSDVQVESIVDSIYSDSVQERLKEYDIIIGALDSDRARMILNDFAVQYLKYYLDAGSGILQSNGKVTHAGGQVNVIIPGISPCLYCNDNLDWKMILYESMHPKEREFEVKQGYIQNVDEPSPSVVSINGLIASALVNEFLALTTGLRKPNCYTYFDFMAPEKMMFSLKVFRNQDCVVCSKNALLGSGDIYSVKQSKKNVIPSFIMEEYNESRRTNDSFKQNESRRYKPITRNIGPRGIRPRYWYKQYI